MSDEELRQAIVARIRAEVEPLLEVDSVMDGGYNCCGCSTYYSILEHCIAVVLDQPYERVTEEEDDE